MQFERKLRLLTAAGAVLLLLNAAVPYFALHAVADAERAVDRAHSVAHTVREILSAMKDSETGQRGYLLTGNTAFLEPYELAAAALPGQLVALRIAAAPEMLVQTEELERAIATALQFHQSVITLKRLGRGDEALLGVTNGEGKARFDALRKVATSLAARADLDAAALRGAAAIRLRHAQAAAVVLSMLDLLVFGFGYRKVTRNMRARENAERDALRAAEESLLMREAAQESLYSAQQQRERLEKLGRMADALLTSRTTSEARQAAEKFCSGLLSRYQGSISEMHPSRDMADVVASWNDWKAPASFSPEDCQALRRGQTYEVRDPRYEVVCRHLAAHVTGPYMCVPLVAQGDVFGLLSVASPTSDVLDADAESLVHTVGEQLSLAFANVRLREALRRQSIIDPLSGLCNRRYLEEALPREIARARRAGKQVSVIMGDIDHFKRINDTYGHDAGDEAIRAVSSQLKQSLRKSDIACRYGGEEFVLVMPEATIEQAMGRADSIRATVASLRLNHGSIGIEPLTMSFGVASFPLHALDEESLLKTADHALYRAKMEGRDRTRVARAPAAENVLQRSG